MSSSGRSDERANLVSELAYVGSVSAVVCGEDAEFEVYLAAGAGQVAPLVTMSDLVPRRPVGANAEVRDLRFGNDGRRELRGLIDDRLDEGMRTMPADNSSAEALFRVAAEQTVPGGHVVVVSDMVEQTATTNLNRPLVDGEGASAAAALSIPKLGPDITVTIVGVAQIDGGAPPDPIWVREVRKFAEAVCAASGAKCRIFSTATPNDIFEIKE